MARGSVFATLAVAGCLVAGAAQAGTISLGQSLENYVLYGQGAVSPGIGSFTNQQGDESYDPGTNTTTDTLSGAITGSTVPGLGSGNYSFITTYTGTPVGDGGTEIQSQSNPANTNFFFYTFFDPSVDMTLKLTGTPRGDLTIPLVTNGSFDKPSFFFFFTSTSCTVVAVCTQNNVGLTPGSAEFGPVTISVSIPEPAEWAMLLLGFGAIGAMARLRSRRQTA